MNTDAFAIMFILTMIGQCSSQQNIADAINNCKEKPNERTMEFPKGRTENLVRRGK